MEIIRLQPKPPSRSQWGWRNWKGIKRKGFTCWCPWFAVVAGWDN